MFEKEITCMKDKVNDLEEKLLGSEAKIKNLEEKLSRNVKVYEKNEENDTNCKVCGKTFDSKKNLDKHIGDCHPFQIRCQTCACAAYFSKNSDLEVHLEECNEHIEIIHVTNVTKWRLKKHVKSHADENIKFCHYFNNGKICPFEKLGCMFSHQDSEICYFGVRCMNKLCQFKHTQNLKDDTEDAQFDDLNQKYNELTETDKIETQEVFYFVITTMIAIDALMKNLRRLSAVMFSTLQMRKLMIMVQ